MKRAYLLPLLFISIHSYSQTTYYVAATGGDDRNAGTNVSPWATITYAVSAVSTGDVIYLLPGTHIINTQVLVPVGVNITGAGESSIISSNVTTQYKSTLLLHSAAEGTNGNQSISYIKMEGNQTAWGAIQVNARSNVHIHHCSFANFFSCGVIFNASTLYSGPPTVFATGNRYYNNISDNCSDYPLADDGQGHVMFGGQDGIEIYNNTMTQNSRELKRNGYLIKFYSYGYSKRFKIYNNNLNRAIGSQGYPYYDFSIETWHTLGGAEIYNNIMTGGIDVGGGITYNCLITGGYEYGIWIHDNIIGPETYAGTETTGIYLECNTDGAIIERNHFKNQYNGIMVTPGSGQTCKNHKIRYNTFNNIRYYGIRFINGANGGFASNIELHNNVFNAGSTSLVGIGLFSVGTTNNIRIINNIIVGFDYASMFANGSSGQTIDNLFIQNNILYQNGSSNNVVFSSLTPTNYLNSGNIISDPQFYSSTNFHLVSGSPGVDAGLKISDGLVDPDGVGVGDPPNIGCYEALADLASPAISDAVIEDNNPRLLILSFNMPLAPVIPDRSAFSVSVNNNPRNVALVSIAEGKVNILLEEEVSQDDIITITYNIPAENPLQSVFNINASSFTDKAVINNVEFTKPEEITSTVSINVSPNPVKDHLILNISGELPYVSTVLRIINAKGLIVSERLLTSEMIVGTLYFDLIPGIYLAVLLYENLIIGSTKFVVTD
jgi:hypothetical protein